MTTARMRSRDVRCSRGSCVPPLLACALIPLLLLLPHRRAGFRPTPRPYPRRELEQQRRREGDEALAPESGQAGKTFK